MSDRPLVLGTRGSALALVQASAVQRAFEESAAWDRRPVERKIIKTTGDRRQGTNPRDLRGRNGGEHPRELGKVVHRHHRNHRVGRSPAELRQHFFVHLMGLATSSRKKGVSFWPPEAAPPLSGARDGGTAAVARKG